MAGTSQRTHSEIEARNAAEAVDVANADGGCAGVHSCRKVTLIAVAGNIGARAELHVPRTQESAMTYFQGKRSSDVSKLESMRPSDDRRPEW